MLSFLSSDAGCFLFHRAMQGAFFYVGRCGGACFCKGGAGRAFGLCKKRDKSKGVFHILKRNNIFFKLIWKCFQKRLDFFIIYSV